MATVSRLVTWLRRKSCHHAPTVNQQMLLEDRVVDVRPEINAHFILPLKRFVCTHFVRRYLNWRLFVAAWIIVF